MPVWIGVDAGTQQHHAAAIDDSGKVLWSVRFANEQTAIAEVLSRAAQHDGVVRWATDLIGGETALLRAMLVAAGHSVLYVPGRMVKMMAGGFPGEAKTDARDAVVIANTARLRRDLTTVAASTELIATLGLLVAHRADLIDEWVRGVSRLRRLVLGICPALDRELDFTTVGVLVLISAYPTPQQLRAAGREQLLAHLRQHRGVHAAKVADKALDIPRA